MAGRPRQKYRRVCECGESHVVVWTELAKIMPADLNYASEKFRVWSEVIDAAQAFDDALRELAGCLYARLIEDGKEPLPEREDGGVRKQVEAVFLAGTEEDGKGTEEEGKVAVVEKAPKKPEPKPRQRKKAHGIKRVEGCRTSGRLKLR